MCFAVFSYLSVSYFGIFEWEIKLFRSFGVEKEEEGGINRKGRRWERRRRRRRERKVRGTHDHFIVSSQ